MWEYIMKTWRKKQPAKICITNIEMYFKSIILSLIIRVRFEVYLLKSSQSHYTAPNSSTSPPS